LKLHLYHAVAVEADVAPGLFAFRRRAPPLPAPGT
jgi:hypothetical protein